MPGPSLFYVNKAIDHNLRGQAYTAPPSLKLSLHTADPGDSGANEVVGGSYARQTIVLTAASGGHTDNSGVINFVGMPGVASPGVRYGGLWDGNTGDFLGSGPVATAAAFLALATASSDLFSTVVPHGRSAGDPIEFEAGLAGVLPTGITAGQVYYVIAAGLTTTAFAVSATAGGSAVNLTGDGSAVCRVVTEKVVQAGDTFQVLVGDFDFTFIRG